ncbi:MAG: acetyl-CoA carboxylase biotin carboxyl carrier protein [Chthoniobacteraceae bacterium]
MDLKDIKELIALMRKNDLAEIEIEQEGHRIKIKKGAEPVAPIAYAPAPPAPAPSTPTAAAGEAKPQGREIVSPMVGTFYSAETPESSPYVEVGTEITEDTVVCIIEAMKVMNQIKAETRGVVTEILVENGKPVQYGQALFRLK